MAKQTSELKRAAAIAEASIVAKDKALQVEAALKIAEQEKRVLMTNRKVRVDKQTNQHFVFLFLLIGLSDGSNSINQIISHKSNN